MRKIILFALTALVATAGTAAADRGRHRGWERREAPVTVRDHRWTNNNTVRVQPSRRVYDRRVVIRDRRPIYLNNGRYYFSNGQSYVYNRPTIRYRYTDYRYRPQILVENYQPVAGYVWIAGHWDWNGYEWMWNAGHYEIDPNYQYSSYDDDDGYYGHSHTGDCDHDSYYNNY
ncbi:MAG TPA: hypothetical protein VFQ53_16340 [Kofleriaceae bacterium]|nr:hypothetical protein [Kofleriaceae bacterium]